MKPFAKRRPGRPSGVKSDETRQRIVRAARQVFSQLGYEGATFQAIANRADLTRPAINHYFANKSALYQEVVDRTNELVIGAGIERALAATTLASRIAALIAVAHEVNSQHPSTAAFMATDVMESQRNTEVSSAGNDTVDSVRAFLTWAVNDAIERGELAADLDAAALVEEVMVVACGVVFYAGFIGSDEQIDSVAESVRDLLTHEFLRLSPP
ncbi:TetR/AcrR family transcriptional regulator [Mycobacterium spongiae]|uniref:TetR family transcriptional regulator n=1 Tax=Mycobacterium spongiae TaxID=886343 RepID=A0A975JWH5_9MYCO|nr:TetR/AcrR family transcriptional regulator [Mycobacterium spongiae]QUR66975.1 TetR family transcriptional regulator [Mycobacterium spongiae]